METLLCGSLRLLQSSRCRKHCERLRRVRLLPSCCLQVLFTSSNSRRVGATCAGLDMEKPSPSSKAALEERADQVEGKKSYSSAQSETEPGCVPWQYTVHGFMASDNPIHTDRI
ncbi:unnamed protein product [Pleuronectes platessa]|uniref:Uncharacterized protein n=1 Tax=Pleuronectes platessa TaxID=8262 RepID=A0A9N7VVU5_PLEPL|nr:unnamed protein product [Pleuronectes platessa]